MDKQEIIRTWKADFNAVSALTGDPYAIDAPADPGMRAMMRQWLEDIGALVDDFGSGTLVPINETDVGRDPELGVVLGPEQGYGKHLATRAVYVIYHPAANTTRTRPSQAREDAPGSANGGG